MQGGCFGEAALAAGFGEEGDVVAGGEAAAVGAEVEDLGGLLVAAGVREVFR